MNKYLRPVFVASLALAIPAAALAQAVAPAATGEAATLNEAHAIIEIMFPPAERTTTVDKILDQFAAQYRASIPADAMGDAGLKAIVERELDKSREQLRPLVQRHMPGVFEATATAYAHQFSLAELKDIHAFALTSSGRHYLSASPTLLGDPAIASANASMLADTQQLMKSMLPGMMEDLVAYLKAHPDVAAKIDAANKGK
jgi:hypothetical protein